MPKKLNIRKVTICSGKDRNRRKTDSKMMPNSSIKDKMVRRTSNKGR